MTTQETALITEGTTELFVYKNKTTTKGPSSRDTTPFYNPTMQLNRDVSIAVNQWLINTSTRHVSLLDGLAASGIRGVRFANELSGDFDVTINDRDDASYGLLQQNVTHVSKPNITTCQRDLNSLLSEARYHSIDIDPFGSPVYFIDSAVRSIYHNGMIACTATDTAALCGVFPNVCYRRYGARSFHAPCMHELGLRILIGFICREAAKYDRGITPLLCYTTDHYHRVYIQVHSGKAAANTSMKHFASVSSLDIPLSPGPTTMVGPLWTGPLQHKQVIQQVRTIISTKQLQTKHQLWKLLFLLEEEAEGPAFFYTVNDLASLFKAPPPAMNHIMTTLKNQGYLVTLTHCTPTGFKTDAPLKAIKEVFNQ